MSPSPSPLKNRVNSRYKFEKGVQDTLGTAREIRDKYLKNYRKELFEKLFTCNYYSSGACSRVKLSCGADLNADEKLV